MSEQEFWRSTLRQILVLERQRQEEYAVTWDEPPAERGSGKDLLAWASGKVR